MIDDNELKLIHALVDKILRIDGDRDYMNTSDLTVVETVIAAKALRICANEIERLQLEIKRWQREVARRIEESWNE